MPTLTEETTIDAKARELCQFIVDDPEFAEAWGKIETFMEDETAQGLYEGWQEKGRELHRMGHEGLEPSEADVLELEKLKEAVLANPVAMAFAQSEDKMNQIFGSVTRLLQKTLQLGRLPEAGEMAESGCCGNSGCGCH